LRAYAADTGRELWKFPAQAAIIAAPISYRAGRDQYVTVVVGMGTSVALDPKQLGGLEFDHRSQKRRILTFRIGGKAKLPPAPPLFKLKAIPDPTYQPDPALTAKGEGLFGRNCLACHGYNATAAGAAPDLRASFMVQDPAAFREIVQKGVLKEPGMPPYPEFGDPEIEALRQYLRKRAADLREGKD
jgi:quinohemoprotein ethanol dehydrogenase